MRHIKLIFLLLLLVTTSAMAGQEPTASRNATKDLISPPTNSTKRAESVSTESSKEKKENVQNATSSNMNATISNSTQPNKNSEKELKENPFLLKELSSLRSQLDMLEVKVKIAEREKKLHELKLATKPVIKKVLLPKVKIKKKTKRRIVWPKIISIQGVDGKLSATLSDKSGVQIVHEGDKAGLGKIISITASKVIISSKGKSFPLKFKE